MRRSAFLLLALCVAPPLAARYRVGDSPLFLQETRKGRMILEAQGKQFAIQADTIRMESALQLEVGINDRLSFEFSYPFLMEEQGGLSKSGQGDLLAALSYHHPVPAWPFLQLGVRQALIFPSGFRRELAGFDSFTAGRTQSETLVQLEFGDSPTEKSPLWLSLNGGIRTDNHLENSQLLWGASMRYHLFKRWVFVESELAQEMSTATKEARYQFSAGAGLRLPFGFQFRVGAEERVLYDLDRFGLYAGLRWQHQPPQLIRLQHRHLRDFLHRQLEEKNRVPSFTLEPGTPALLTEAGRLPFLPLRVALLPVEDTGGAPVALALCDGLRQAIEADTSFQIIPADEVRRVLLTQHLDPERMVDEHRLNEIGRALYADLVLQGRVLSFEPALLSGFHWPPFLAGTRSGSRLEARLWLHQVDQPGPPVQALLSREQQGKRRWSTFPVTHGHREKPGSAVERSQLMRQVMDAWCASARESLLYEVTEQTVVQE